MEQLALLNCVRDVSLDVNAGEPTAVTQRAFDAAAERAQAERRLPTRLPKARQITERLRKPWHEVLTIAHEPAGKHSLLLGVKEREEPVQDWLTDDYVRYVLRSVANQLGKTTLTRGEYSGERDAMLAEDASHWAHAPQLLLPSEDAIVARLGDWDAALSLAGLEVGGRSPRMTTEAVVSRVELMERFYDCYGEQPSVRTLREFALSRNLAFGCEGGRPFSDALAEWLQSRRDAGLPEPRVVERRGGHGPRLSDYRGEPTGSATSPTAANGSAHGEQRHRGKWANSKEACAQWVARYISSVPHGQHSTKRGYAAWARTQPGAPSCSSFDRHGGFGRIREIALTLPATNELTPSADES